MVAEALTIVITGQPFVKKNNQKTSFRGGKPRRYFTKSFNNWHEESLRQLARMGYNVTFKEENKARKKMNMPFLVARIDYGVNLQCKFFINNTGRVDLSALYEGIQDVLVEVGLLSDDCSTVVCSHDGSGVYYDKENPRMEITITRRQTS